MDTLQVIAPLIGVVLGGALSGITAHLRARRERKRVLASALSDLLEVRHRVVSVELLLQRVAAIARIEPQHLSAIRDVIESLAPLDDAVHSRYDTAITLLAEVDPVLAFDLRSKNAFPRVLSVLRAVATQADANLAEFEAFESLLRSAAAPGLNGAIQKLAWSHSIVTAVKVKRLLRRTQELPPDVDAFLTKLPSLGGHAQQTTTPEG